MLLVVLEMGYLLRSGYPVSGTGEMSLVVLGTGYLSRSGYPVSDDVRQQARQCWDLKVRELVG